MKKNIIYTIIACAFILFPCRSYGQDYMTVTFDMAKALITGGDAAIGKNVRQVRQENELSIACFKIDGDTAVYGGSESEDGYQFVDTYTFVKGVCVERFVMYDDVEGGWIKDAFDTASDIVQAAGLNPVITANRCRFKYRECKVDMMVECKGRQFILYVTYTTDH